MNSDFLVILTEDDEAAANLIKMNLFLYCSTMVSFNTQNSRKRNVAPLRFELVTLSLQD